MQDLVQGICYNSCVQDTCHITCNCTTPSTIKSFKPLQGCQALLQALTSTDLNKKVSKGATHGADDLLLLILTYGFIICVVYSFNTALNTHTDRDIYEVGLWLQSTISFNILDFRLSLSLPVLYFFLIDF